MESRHNHVTTSVRTEGGLLPSDLLAKIAGVEPDVPGLSDADFGLAAGERFRESITRSWNRLVGAWAALEAVRVTAEPTDTLTSPTRERFLLPLFEELGFGRLSVARAIEIEGTSYPMSHDWNNRVPIHLVGFGVELDARTKGVRGAAGAAPHALVQEYLNRSDAALWGFVANGRVLRLLRDSTSLTRQAYVEFDLEAIFTGELFADFALLWTVCHRTRFEGARPVDCLLEQWTKKASEDGTRALDKLRGGVEEAIETLGAGFLAHPANSELREALRSGSLDRQDYYRELLRLVYRLIFLFTAEDRRDEESGRELLLDPDAPDDAVERYRRYYSTVRLRSFSSRRRGTRHPDLWVALRQVMTALGADGAPSLGLPALGSYLFGEGACPHLDGADLRNQDLLDAVRALATIEEDRRRRLVDYRNLGAEELGGVYEGLLQLHPVLEIDASPPRFRLRTAAGNERKTSGSYYTPTILINTLLDSALDPVIDAAVRGKAGDEAEAALLGLTVVDPAAGSGHFLVAAARRMAKRLAVIRTNEIEPPPRATRHALRDVISRCIYGVDLNPMAVELCKVSLWLEALEPGRPLSFLDSHIRRGNSLIGASPELVAGGVPDTAFEAITGDDKQVVKAWRTQNRLERDGQQTLFEAELRIPTDVLARDVGAVDALSEDTPSAVSEKVARHATYLASVDHLRAVSVMNAWCAAFVVPKVPGAPVVSTATVRAIGTGVGQTQQAIRDAIEGVATEYAFFHWSLEFPTVYERGGFDVVVGNPPWERVKLQEVEYFAERSPAIAGARNAAQRKRMIASLEESDPALWSTFRDALRHSDGESHFLRDSGRYPLAGRGDFNTSALFVELMQFVVGDCGRVGAIVPTGIATDDTTKVIFGALVSSGRLVALFDFVNDRGYFPGVGHGRQRFCLLTLGRRDPTAGTRLAFFLHTPSDLDEADAIFALTPDDFALLNPNTNTCPTFRSTRDADIAKAVYRRVPVLENQSMGDPGNPWGISFMAMFHMSMDSGSFREDPGPDRLVLYEAKMAHQFNHRYGDYGLRAPSSQDTELPRPSLQDLARADYSVQPKWWIDRTQVEDRLAGRWQRGWLLGWRDICRSTDERTLISTILPVAGVGDKFLLMFSDDPRFALVVGNLNSVALDWQVRQKLGGTSLKYFVMRQLPVLPPEVYSAPAPWAACSVGDWMRPYLAELIYTDNQLAPYARDLGWTGEPFEWSEERRQILRAELDAAFLLLYGHNRQDAEHILTSFPIWRRNEERRTGTFQAGDFIMEAYDRMSVASAERPFRSRLSLARSSSEGETSKVNSDSQWIPWSEIVSRPALVGASSRGEGSPIRKARRTRKQELGVTQQGLGLAAELVEVSASSARPDVAWREGATLRDADVTVGMVVRHHSFGQGVVEEVRPTVNGAELRIRFETTGERWLTLGSATLQFAVTD